MTDAEREGGRAPLLQMALCGNLDSILRVMKDGQERTEREGTGTRRWMLAELASQNAEQGPADLHQRYDFDNADQGDEPFTHELEAEQERADNGNVGDIRIYRQRVEVQVDDGAEIVDERPVVIDAHAEARQSQPKSAAEQPDGEQEADVAHVGIRLPASGRYHHTLDKLIPRGVLGRRMGDQAPWQPVNSQCFRLRPGSGRGRIRDGTRRAPWRAFL